MIVNVFGIPFSSMKFVLIVHRFWDGFGLNFWCFFDTFSVCTCNLLNHQKHLFYHDFQGFYLPFRETWFLMFFLIFFVTCFGIDFWWVLASILAPFWDPFGFKFNVFWWSCFWWIFGSIVDRLLIKNRSRIKTMSSCASLPFRILFPRTCSFCQRKTCKRQKQGFPIFSNN